MKKMARCIKKARQAQTMLAIDVARKMPSSEGAWQPLARSTRYALFSSMFRHAFSKDTLTETANAQWSNAMGGEEEQELSRKVDEIDTSDLRLLLMTLPKFSHADFRIVDCQAYCLLQPSLTTSGQARQRRLPAPSFAFSLARRCAHARVRHQ